jgi:hypothetical protein
MKTIIEIEIKDITVEDGYYSFKYWITVNGKRRKGKTYDSDYDGQTAKQFRKILEDGHAVELALEHF